MADRATLWIYQGDDYSAVVTVFDSSGQPADLTDYLAQAQIRFGPADTNPVVLAEIDTVIASPLIYLSIPNSLTGTLAGRYQWDLQLTAPDGAITTILAGAAIVTQEITREAAA
jgi:hypothetical protein